MTLGEFFACVEGYVDANSPRRPEPPSEQEFLEALADEMEEGKL